MYQGQKMILDGWAAQHFKKYLGEKNWSFKKKIANPYKYIDEANIIVFMISTLGYEAIARNKKVLSFCCKRVPQFSKKKILRAFAWPVYSHDKKGFFWTDENYDQKEVNKILDRIIGMKITSWKSKIKKLAKDLMVYDNENRQIINLIKKSIK